MTEQNFVTQPVTAMKGRSVLIMDKFNNVSCDRGKRDHCGRDELNTAPCDDQPTSGWGLTREMSTLPHS